MTKPLLPHDDVVNKKETIYLYDDNIGCVQYIQHMGSDKTAVSAARVSFGKDNDEALNEKDINLIKYLLENNHTSPFEHSNITFKMTVPLFVRSQHMRHRTWKYVSINEISRRYTSENLGFYEPLKFRTQHSNDRQASNEGELINPVVGSCGYLDDNEEFIINHASRAVKNHNKECLALYNDLIKNGICREQARGVLPQNLYTEYFCTTDLHNLMHFLKLRLDKRAQWEIVQVAKACLEITEEHFPETMKIWKSMNDFASSNSS